MAAAPAGSTHSAVAAAPAGSRHSAVVAAPTGNTHSAEAAPQAQKHQQFGALLGAPQHWPPAIARYWGRSEGAADKPQAPHNQKGSKKRIAGPVVGIAGVGDKILSLGLWGFDRFGDR